MPQRGKRKSFPLLFVMERILIVDDEQDLREILQFNLESEGFEVSTAPSAEEALALMQGGLRVDLILLDVMMERMSGFDMAQRLRQGGDATPIIFLTALTGEPNLLLGFERGGDDYIEKPFSFQTVLARVRAVLKRSAPEPLPAELPTLTRREQQILDLLRSHRGQYFTREEIMRRVWERDAVVGDRSVDVHIARIRKKLGPSGERIASRTGYGYYYR